MSTNSSGYLRRLGRAIDSHDDDRIVTLVETAIKEDPSNAGILTWSCLATSDNLYLRRVVSYALSKTASEQPPYLWAPLAHFLTTSWSEDQSTLANVLSSLTRYRAHDDVLTAVLAPSFGSFATHCLDSSPIVQDGICGLLISMGERKLLSKLLSQQQAEMLVAHLNSVPVIAGMGSEVAESIQALSSDAPPNLPNDHRVRIVEEERTLSELASSALPVAVLRLVREALATARASYECREQAERSGGIVEQVTLSGSDPNKGRLAIETFEKLVHSWRMAVREAVASVAPDVAATMKTYALVPAPGSFLLRFIVSVEQPEVFSAAFERMMGLVQDPEQAFSSSNLSAESKGHFFQFIETLAQRRLDATIGLTDARSFEGARTRIRSRHIAPAIKRMKQEPEGITTRSQIQATLEGASQRHGHLEIVTEDGRALKGEVPRGRRSVLLQKVIGRQYLFTLDEVVTPAVSGETKSRLELVSVDASSTSTTMPIGDSLQPQRELASGDVPQQDRLDRIVEVVKLVSAGSEPNPAEMRMADTSSSKRHIDYMKHGAKVLGLVGQDGTITDAGQRLAQLPESRILDFLSVQFELSMVARRWKEWASARDLHKLDPGAAEQFLLGSRLSMSMAKRRGRTLKTWVVAFQERRLGNVDP